MISLKKEFDSERALPAIKPLAQTPSLEESPVQPSEEGNFVYFMRGYDISLTPIQKRKNTYLLQIKTLGTPMIAFGGIDSINANYFNNIIFFNQWSEGTSRKGAFILLKNTPYKIPSDPCMTVLISNPHYDKGSGTASFTLTPQDEMRSEFLSQGLDSCVLLIQFNQQEF